MAAEWGNVAEWVAAIGTSGALIATVILVGKERGDRKDARELHARQVGISETADYGAAQWFVKVTTAAPISQCVVKVFGMERGQESEPIAAGLDAIHPPEATIGLPWPPPQVVTSVFVEFNDMYGKRWRRTLQGLEEVN